MVERWKGKRTDVTKDDLKEIYFKRQDVLPLEKYVNLLKECYNKLEDLGQTEFKAQKVWILLDHINCTDHQVETCVHTARKDHKFNF